MGVLVMVGQLGRSSSTMTMAPPPKKKWMQHYYMQGEEPKDYGQLEQALPEEASDVERRSVGYTGSASRGLRDGAISSVLTNGGYTSISSLRDQSADLIGNHKLSPATPVVGNGASVIQRLGPSTIVSSTISGSGPLNGSRGGSSVASLYSYNNDERIRSPSPVYCNGKESSTSPPLMVSNNNVINGSSASVVRSVYPSSPSTSRMPAEALDHPHSVQQPQPQASQYGSVSSSSLTYNRLDDLASRSHRLEEALLRASTNRRSPTTTSSSVNLASGTASSQFQTIHGPNSSAATGGAGGGSSAGGGRNSATDELQELKKRSGAGTREVHNKLEKNRRAHLRECFEVLRKQLPAVDDKKLSNLGILKSALRYIQSLKRKEREYEHTMERLAREKIAAQQRLATLRKEVSTIPGSSAEAGLLDLGSVLPVLHQSQQPILEQSTPSHLTFANVQAHTLREESKHLGGSSKIGSNRGEPQDQEDRESNSTSTASERGDLSDHEDDEKPFQESYRRQQRPPHHNAHHRSDLAPSSALDYGHRLPNGRVVSPVPYVSHNSNSCDSSRGVKRVYGDEETTNAASSTTEAAAPPPPPPLPVVREDNSRPHFRYVKAATNVVSSGQPAFLTMATSSAGAHVLELAAASSTATSDIGAAGKVEASGGLYAVRQPIAFATTTAGNSLSAHIQLGPQVLSAHHHHTAGVQLFPSLKVLAPSSMAGVRVISADGATSSLQPLVAVHPPSAVSGTKSSEDVASSLLNGTNVAVSTATATGSFCFPTGMVIPNLVALPPESVASSNAGTSSLATSSASITTSYEQLAAAVRNPATSQQLKHAPTISTSSTVLSLQNGLLKGTVNRSIAIQPSATAGVTHVMTPLNVTARLPLVTSMAVMQPTKHVAHILANPTLEKVGVASPLLKTTPGIPTIITGGQYLTSPALGGRHVIKPVVVVAAPPPHPPPQPSSSPPVSSSSLTSSSSGIGVSSAGTPPSREAAASALHSALTAPPPSSSATRSSPSPPSKPS